MSINTMEEIRGKTRKQEEEEGLVTIDPQAQGKTKNVTSIRNLFENIFVGHVIFSTIILVIHAPLVTVFLNYQLTIDCLYYFLAMASIISISFLSLTITKKRDDPWVKIVLVVVLHVSAALVVAPVLGRYGTSPFHVYINYVVITATTILTATLWAMINQENFFITDSKDVDPPANKNNSSGSSIIIGVTGLLLLILFAFFFWVNSAYDVTFRTSVFSWFSVFSVFLNLYTIGHMSYVQRTIFPHSVLDIVVRIHTNFFSVLMAFVVLVLGSILFFKAMVVTMDTMGSMGLIKTPVLN